MKKISTTYLSKISLFATALLFSLSVNIMDAYAQGNSNKNKNNGNGNGNGACLPIVGATFSSDGKSVTAQSTKDLSNVVLKFCDGEHQKFDGLSGYSQTFSGTGSNVGKTIEGIWIKSGCNNSGDGPGYGQYVPNPDANACNPLPATCYAHEVVSYNPGKRFDGSDVPTLRANPEKALGEPDKSDATTTEANVNFVALGFGGELTVKFLLPIKNGPGADVRVWETTFAPSTGNCAVYPESINVFASQDGCNWKYIGTGCQDTDFDLENGGLGWAQYIRLVDVSPKASFASVGHITDGYDVDGIECLNGYESDPIFEELDCQFATFIVDYAPGPRKNASAPLVERQNADNSLGEPQRVDNLNFVSLGYGGSLILGFSCVIFDKPGNDIEIVETSFGPQTCTSYPEKAQIFGSLDLNSWDYLGEVCLDGFIDFGGKGPFQFIRIQDDSNPANFGNGNDQDGYDVDGVVVLQPGCNGGARYSAPNNNLSTSSEINVYPNPFSDFVTLDFINGVSENRLNITVFNYMGQKVIDEQISVATETAFRQQIDLGAYPKGFYIINVNSGNSVKTFKVIKQ